MMNYTVNTKSVFFMVNR